MSKINVFVSFDLDHDGTWIMGGGYGVWTFDENTFSYATLKAGPTTMGQTNALCINRAPGGPEIATPRDLADEVCAIFHGSLTCRSDGGESK